MDEAEREWEEKFRWCVYCKADCWVDDPEHAADCPSSTGVFPVRDEDVVCHSCKETYIGMLCGECRAELKVGDSYMHKDQGDNCYLVVCVGCAAKEAVA